MKLFNFLCKIVTDCKFWSFKLHSCLIMKMQFLYWFIKYFQRYERVWGYGRHFHSFQKSLFSEKKRPLKNFQNLQENSFGGISFLTDFGGISFLQTFYVAHYCGLLSYTHFARNKNKTNETIIKTSVLTKMIDSFSYWVII